MVHAKSKSDGNFLKLIDCFVSGNTRLTAALILCRVNDEVIVTALGMERLHQTILPILETACLSYQNQSKEGLETFRNVCREMIGQLYIFNNKVHLAHRDIKPCNVMTSEINQSSPLRVRLVDFGQVQSRDQVYQKMDSAGMGPAFPQGVFFCSSSFPPVVKHQIRSIGSGTPGYYCTAKQADGKQTESFESAVSSRDQYGLAMTLLHGVIPNFKATSFSKIGAPKDVDDFCKTLKLLLPGGSEVEYLTCMPCRRLVDLVFNLLFTPEFDLEKALYSAFILEPELSLDEESDLSKGIVIRCINHETGLPCKPLILMKFKGKGYVVFQYCAYRDGEIAGYYAGRYIRQSYSTRECIDIRAASVHVLCLRDNNSGDILVGDISHTTPLSTYTSHGKILSFAQSSFGDDRKPFGTLKKPSIHTEEVKKVKLDDGTEFGFIPMRAYETAEGLQLSTWRYPWGVAAGGKSVYSVEEEEKLAADASEAIADEVLENLNKKFR
jgi:serine/threonine protein kinase